MKPSDVRLVLPLPARPATVAIGLVRRLATAADGGTRLPLPIQLEVALEQQRSALRQLDSRRDRGSLALALCQRVVQRARGASPDHGRERLGIAGVGGNPR